MIKWIAVLLLALAGPALAGERVTLDSCRGGDGKAIEVIEDAAAARPVEVVYADGQARLVTNGAALPGLSADAASFLFARACAQAARGGAAAGSVAGAAAEDCEAIGALLRSGLLDSEARVIAIEANLRQVDPGWQLLPAPPRNWALRACFRRAGLQLGGMEALADQPGWNRCVHRCGETLRRCQRDHFRADGACMGEYDSCSAVCDFKAE